MQNNVENATNNGGEAIKLLELSSSDSLESPNFSHFPAPKPKRKVRFKKAFRSNSKLKLMSPHASNNCSCHLGVATRILFCVLLLALIFALVCYVISLSTKIEELQKRFHSIESTIKTNPEEFHTIHSKLKDLDANVSTLFLDIKKNSIDIENATAAIKQLKEVANGLQESITAASTIQQLPKDVSSLTQNVLTFGKQLTDMDNTVKELKESQTSVQSTTQNLSSEVEFIKVSLQNLSNSEKQTPAETPSSLEDPSAIKETESRITFLQQGLWNLTSSMEKLNSSYRSQLLLLQDLPEDMDFLNKTVHTQQDKIYTFESYIQSNVTIRLKHLEAECLQNSDKPLQYSNMSEILNLVNKTVIRAVVNIVQSNSSVDEGILGVPSKTLVGAHNGLLLLAELLKQFWPVGSQAWMSEENATVAVAHLLNNSFHELMKEHDSKIEVLQEEVNQLFAQMPFSKNLSPTSSNAAQPPPS